MFLFLALSVDTCSFVRLTITFALTWTIATYMHLFSMQNIGPKSIFGLFTVILSLLVLRLGFNTMQALMCSWHRNKY